MLSIQELTLTICVSIRRMELLREVEAVLRSIGDDWNADNAEHGMLDFKETPETSGDTGKHARKRFAELLAETAVCFANAQGGAIVVGVRDRAATRADAIAGIGSYTGEQLNDLIFERTAPPIICRAAAIDVDGKDVVALLVPPGESVHSTTQGVYKFRLNDRCVPLAGDRLRGLRALRERYDWTAEPTELGVESLSRAALERASERLAQFRNDDLARMALDAPRDFCSATGLMVGDRLTNAAILLYGTPKALRSAIPNWGVNAQSRETSGSEPKMLMRPYDTDLCLVLLLDHLITLFGVLASVHPIRIGAEQVELVDYPPDALREIIANAFAHRDWEAPGWVEIVHSPDELVVASPGGLLPTLRIDRLLHDAAAPRNPLLASNMARLRLAEMAGLGLDRAFREIARVGKEPPVLEDGPRFRVTMRGGPGDEAFARYINGGQFPGQLANSVDVLMVLTALRNVRTVSAARLASRLQRGNADVEQVLRRMAEADIIQPTRSTRPRAHPSYALTPRAIAGLKTAVRYRTTDIDSDDKKLIGHLQRYGRISNEDVRNYLDCDVGTARNRLAALRRRGLIDFAADSPRRGARVVYVPTDRLSSDQ